MEVFILKDTYRGDEIICVCNTLELALKSVSEFEDMEDERPENGRVVIETSKLITS